MNERIRELAKEAGIFYYRKGKLQVDMEKFAELIVRECIKVVDDTMTENQEMNIGLVMASAAIVAHFEVEE
jgi:hypothetical protein